ncbi:ECA polysaccharide chain length modulation protein [Enterobacteriaceae bacterium LUAb1]
MKTETEQSVSSGNIENELDIRALCCTLWRGRMWMIGLALLCALVAFIYSLLVRQQWSVTAITGKPSLNQPGPYYSQRQFLRSIGQTNDTVSPTLQSSITDEVWQEFVMQLSSWDTRRAFWLQTDYFKARKSGHAKKDAIRLNEMINNIQYTPADSTKNLSDSVKLVAETAADANNLLRQYIEFASQRTAHYLNNELMSAWSVHIAQLQTQITGQERVAKAVYIRQIRDTEQALTIARQQGIEQAKTTTPAEQLPTSELFLLGYSLLQARLESLRASGPDYGLDYYQNRVMLAELNIKPKRDERFQIYRYLRTPEEPIKRDSPRRLFLMVLWGSMGLLTGAGVVLIRRPRR